MKQIYWQLNKKSYIFYLATITLFYILLSIIAFVTHVGTGNAAPVIDIPNNQMLFRVVVPVLIFGILFGGMGVATVVSYFQLLVKPFRKGQLEQVLQIGENVKSYVFFHVVCLAIVSIIPVLALGFVARVFNSTDIMDIYNQVLPSTGMLGNLKLLMTTFGSIGWVLAIPLCIYNDRLFKNVSHKQKTAIFIIGILAIWFTVSMAEGIPEMIQSLNFTSDVLEQGGTLEITNTQSPISFITDILGIGLFAVSYYGFCRFYTIRK